MMDIGESQKDYQKLGAALKALLKGVSPKTVQEEMEQILMLAEKVGHPLLEDVRAMKLAFDRMVTAPGDAQLADIFLKQVLRLEQETREI